jgi:hypothetical protein
MHRKARKLSLPKETLLYLGEDQIGKAAGGSLNPCSAPCTLAGCPTISGRPICCS